MCVFLSLPFLSAARRFFPSSFRSLHLRICALLLSAILSSRAFPVAAVSPVGAVGDEGERALESNGEREREKREGARGQATKTDQWNGRILAGCTDMLLVSDHHEHRVP